MVEKLILTAVFLGLSVGAVVSFCGLLFDWNPRGLAGKVAIGSVSIAVAAGAFWILREIWVS